MLTDIDDYQSLSKICKSCSETKHFEEFPQKNRVRIILEPSLMDALVEFADFVDAGKMQWNGLNRYERIVCYR
jgi:hypothetical protein